jgi:hypothetical protein
VHSKDWLAAIACATSVALVGGCGGTGRSARISAPVGATTSAPTSQATPIPVVPTTSATMTSASSSSLPRGSVVDSACNSGQGADLALPSGWPAEDSTTEIAVASRPAGGTLVAASALPASGPPPTYSELYALTSGCVPDPSFGSDGMEEVTFAGQINSAMALSDGDVVLAGEATNGVAIGRILPSGHPDPTFGNGGSTVLPGPADQTVLAQTSAGEVLVGITAGGGCCGQERVIELTSTGAIVKSFGSDGSAQIPYPRDDSGISRIVVEPGGDILVLTSGGNMGCWGVTVNASRRTVQRSRPSRRTSTSRCARSLPQACS